MLFCLLINIVSFCAFYYVFYLARSTVLDSMCKFYVPSRLVQLLKLASNRFDSHSVVSVSGAQEQVSFSLLTTSQFFSFRFYQSSLYLTFWLHSAKEMLLYSTWLFYFLCLISFYFTLFYLISFHFIYFKYLFYFS